MVPVLPIDGVGVHDKFSVGNVVGDNGGDFADEPLSAGHRGTALPRVSAVGASPEPTVADNDLIVPITPERVVLGSHVRTGAGAIDNLALAPIGEVGAGVATDHGVGSVALHVPNPTT